MSAESKIPTFASRFRFGSSKKQQTVSTSVEPVPTSQALHEINRNGNGNSMVVAPVAVSVINGSASDRSDSPATTMSSNNSASPKENKQQSGKSSKGGGLFGRNKDDSKNKKQKKADKKKEKEEQQQRQHAATANGHNNEPEKADSKTSTPIQNGGSNNSNSNSNSNSTHHMFRFRLFGNFGKNNNQQTPTPNQHTPSQISQQHHQHHQQQPSQTVSGDSLASSHHLNNNKNSAIHESSSQEVTDSAVVMHHGSSGGTMTGSSFKSMSPATVSGSLPSSLLVTTSSTGISSSAATRPTYLPAMVSVDTFGGALSPATLSQSAPMSPPDSNSSLPPHQTAGVIPTTTTASSSSYNHRSTAALPATNPYVKPRAPTSSRPNSPAASPSIAVHPDGGIIKIAQATPPHYQADQNSNNKEDDLPTGFIFRPRLSRPPLSQQPAANIVTTTLSAHLSATTSASRVAVAPSSIRSPSNSYNPSSLSYIPLAGSFTAFSTSMNGGAELLTPSSVESLETRLIAKSLVAPSPPPAARKYSHQTPNTVSIGVGNCKVTPTNQQNMLSMPRVAPLAKVDSLDTNLSASGFCTPALEHAPSMLLANGRASFIDAAESSAEKGAQLLDFARFLQHLTEEQGITSTCMRQSYSLDLRQIPVSTSTHMLANNNYNYNCNNNNTNKVPNSQAPSTVPRAAVPNNNPEPSTSSLLTNITPESCIYCHHPRDGRTMNNNKAAPDSTVIMRTLPDSNGAQNMSVVDPTIQSTLTDVTFATASEIMTSSAVEVTKNGDADDFAMIASNEDLQSSLVQSGSDGNRKSAPSSANNQKPPAPSSTTKPRGVASANSKPSAGTPMVANAAVNNNANGAAPVVEAIDVCAQRQCMEELSHEMASLKVVLERLRGHIIETDEAAIVPPVETIEVSTETEEDFDSQATVVAELRTQIVDLEKELANRSLIIDTLQKLLVEQKMMLDARPERPVVACSTTSTSTETLVLKCGSTQTDAESHHNGNELVVTTSNGHVGIVPCASPTVIRTTKTATVIAKPNNSSAHVGKVHVVVTKPTSQQGPVATLQVAGGGSHGEGNAVLNSPSVSPIAAAGQQASSATPSSSSTAIPAVGSAAKTSGISTGIVRPQTGISTGSGIAKPTTIYRRPATTSATNLTSGIATPSSIMMTMSATSSASTHSSAGENNASASSPMTSSAQALTPSRLPRLTSSASSAIPSPIIVNTGSGRA